MNQHISNQRTKCYDFAKQHGPYNPKVHPDSYNKDVAIRPDFFSYFLGNMKSRNTLIMTVVSEIMNLLVSSVLSIRFI